MAFKRSGVRFPSPPSRCGSFDGISDVPVLERSGSGASGVRKVCGNSSVGRAQPCQGWGRGFESRFPLCFAGSVAVLVFAVAVSDVATLRVDAVPGR